MSGQLIPSPAYLNLSIAQRAANVELASIFSFLEIIPDREVCYRVCKLWLRSCQERGTRNVFEYALTTYKVFSWYTVNMHIQRIKNNPEQNETYVPTVGDNFTQTATKIVRIVKKAAPFIKELSLSRGSLFVYKCPHGLIGWAGTSGEEFRVLFEQEIHFPNVSRLALEIPHVSYRHIQALTYLPRVLSKFPQLIHLTLSDASTGEMKSLLKGASSHPTLKSLTIQEARDEDYFASQELWGYLQGLERISLSMIFDCTEGKLADLVRNLSLPRNKHQNSPRVSLTLGAPSHPTILTIEGMANLTRIEFLSELTIQNMPGLTDAGLEVVSSFKELENLTIDRCNTITPEGVSLLHRARKLATLTLSKYSFLGGFPLLSTFKALQHLIIVKCVGPLNTKEIARCPTLHTLEVSSHHNLPIRSNFLGGGLSFDFRITNLHLAELKSSSTLKTLKLSLLRDEYTFNVNGLLDLLSGSKITILDLTGMKMLDADKELLRNSEHSQKILL